MLDPDGPLPYILLVILVVVSAFSSGTEAAFSYANRHRIKAWAEDGNRKAKLVEKILNNFDRSIISLLIGNNIVNIATTVIATLIATSLLGEVGSLVATIIVTIVIVLFGEILPKTLAKNNPDKWALNASIVVYFVMIILYPLSAFFNLLVKLVCLFFKNSNEFDSFTEDDFQNVVEKIEEEGALDEEESDIIQNAVDFGDITVKEVLTKREDIIAINIKEVNHQFIQQFLLDNNYSRFPVYEGSIDNIIGILNARTYLKETFLHRNVSIRAILSNPYFVNPQIKLDEIFEGFRQHKTHIAIVIDKKKTIGMVTMKDVLEELVGDIDEAGTSDEEGGAV